MQQPCWLLEKAGLDWHLPDFSNLFHRQKTLAVQGPYRQIALLTVTHGPADDGPRTRIEDDSELQPALMGPDVAEVSRLLPGKWRLHRR